MTKNNIAVFFWKVCFYICPLSFRPCSHYTAISTPFHNPIRSVNRCFCRNVRMILKIFNAKMCLIKAKDKSKHLSKRYWWWNSVTSWIIFNQCKCKCEYAGINQESVPSKYFLSSLTAKAKYFVYAFFSCNSFVYEVHLKAAKCINHID